MNTDPIKDDANTIRLAHLSQRASRFAMLFSMVNISFWIICLWMVHEFIRFDSFVLNRLIDFIVVPFAMILAFFSTKRLTTRIINNIGASWINIPNLIRKISDLIEKSTLEGIEIIEYDAPDEISKRLIININKMILKVKEILRNIELSSLTDPLTGRPNRASFKSIVTHKLMQQNITRAAMVFIDLDRFKAVNDTLGHAQGDRLLQLFTERLATIMSQSIAYTSKELEPTISRFGGDEFNIFIPHIENQDQVANFSQRIINCLDDPFYLQGQAVNIGASVGIALCPQDGKDYDLLMRNADIAMFYAKEMGKRNYQFFNESLNKKASERLITETELRQSVQTESFEVYYQPQISSKSRSLMAVEALVRWNHPKRGIVMPGDFISVAEECNIIGDIGAIVLKKAIQQAALWYKQNRSIRVSVNISSVELKNKNFCDNIRNMLDRYELPPWLLELELTETITMQENAESLSKLSALRDLGISLSIDDFGTGYSNLGLLRRLKFDRIKIDRSFINGLENEEDSRMIVSTILAIAHALNYEVVAEGVETARQASILESSGCSLLQGYYISRPVPVDQLETWWAEHKTNAIDLPNATKKSLVA